MKHFNKNLSSSQIEDFEKNGFLVIPRMYSASEIQALSSWIDEIASQKPEIEKQMVYFEENLKQKGEKILSRIEKFTDHHENLKAFVTDPRMTGCVNELLGEPAVLFKEKINFKLPGGGGFKPHQDIQPGWDSYSGYFISVLVTVDRSTSENGCLELAAGHHKRGLIGRKWEPLEGKELEGITFFK